MDFSFDSIDLTLLINNNKNNINKSINNNENNENIPVDTKENKEIINYDKTTCETYRIKRLYKIDPITDIEVPENLAFKFFFEWNPYTGIRGSDDIIGPLYFNALTLYDYYYNNRYKGLWNPPVDNFQGYYGDLIGTSKDIKIRSRGSNPQKYLYRLPIIDCYLPQNHNYSVITMGPELTNSEISQIDRIIIQYHPKRNYSNFTSLSLLKSYYDKALDSIPDPNCDEIIELKIKYPSLSDKEINEKFNRYYVDKLVKIFY
jgi:hypothetical protein